MKDLKHIKRFNESRRDDVRDEISSSFKATGHLVKHEQEIKDDIIAYVDTLLDDEVELIHQLAQLEKGEISENDVDKYKIVGIGQKLTLQLMDIIKKYNKF